MAVSREYTQELMQAAADYASRGFLVLPLYGVRDRGDGTWLCNCSKQTSCKSPGKHPSLKHRLATRDPGLASKRQELMRQCQVCVILDDHLRVVVLDFDGEAGRIARGVIEREYGPLPTTWTQVTGRAAGGEHLFYRVPVNLNYYAVRNRKIAPGFDVKGEAGLVVMAPSTHVSSFRYRFVDSSTEIAELPEWLYQLIASQREQQRELSSSGSRPTDDELESKNWPSARRIMFAKSAVASCEPAIQGQNGSLACLRAAILVVRGYCVPVEPYNFAFEVLWDIYNPLCQPPWSESELLHKIEAAELQVDIPWAYRIDEALRIGLWSDGGRNISPVLIDSVKPVHHLCERYKKPALIGAKSDDMAVEEKSRRGPPLPPTRVQRWLNWSFGSDSVDAIGVEAGVEEVDEDEADE